jgi:hypothetical protein
VVAAIAACFAAVLWLGTYQLMFDYALTRDELMADFDAAIFSAGHLSLPLPAQWHGYAYALVPAFLLDVPDSAVLVSAYGPVNAAMRAGFGLIADPALLNPLLAASGLVSLYTIARGLFAESPGAPWLVLAGYLLSTQIVVNAMTPYAMTAHLAFNLAWLALFLNDRRWSHALALVIGVAAIGIHQVVFHPLFAAPFILLLLARRRYALSAVYAAVYAAALAFWVSWPHLVVASAGISAADGSTASGGSFLTERVVPLLVKHHPFTIPLTLYNLLRAVTWNAAFVLPFMVLAGPALRRREGVAVALVAGLGLTIAAIAFLLPYQGHGWGYRYVHGVLGNALLLAGYGYREFAAVDRERASRLAGLLALGTLPIAAWLLWTTHALVRPYVQLTQAVARQTSDFVVLDTEPPANAVDQVRNRADLTNRPLIFASHGLTGPQLEELCRRGTITLMTRRDFHAAGFGIGKLPDESPDFDRRMAPLAGKPCVTKRLAR